MYRKYFNKLFMFYLLLYSFSVYAEALEVKMYEISGKVPEKLVGTIKIEENDYGVLFTPNLHGLTTTGAHGFHVHENPSCDSMDKNGEIIPGLAAGGHYDPKNTGKHDGPYGEGHLGDLPLLFVTNDGKATYPVLAPRLKLNDLHGRSLMIHVGGDNFSDTPEPLGGGGARMICGIIE